MFVCTKKFKRLLKSLCIFIVANTVSACTLLYDVLGRDYIESVFKRQNALSAEIMLLSETELPQQDYEALLQAEAKMQQECRLLNEAAQRAMDNQESSLGFQKQVRDSVEDCDTSIQNVEAILEGLGLDI